MFVQMFIVWWHAQAHVLSHWVRFVTCWWCVWTHFLSLVWSDTRSHVPTLCPQSCVLDTCLVMCSDKCSDTFDMFWMWFSHLVMWLATNSVTYFCSAWTSACPCGWSHLASSLITCHNHVFHCMFDNAFDCIFDLTAPLPAAPFWNEHSSISAICANVLFVFQLSLGSQRKKALGFENIQSPWCSSFDICITMCRTSFPCGWVQSSCVRWQQQCFLSTYDRTLRW